MAVRGKRYAKPRLHLFLTVKMAFLSLCALTTLFPFYWVMISSFKSMSQIYRNPLAIPKELLFSNYVSAWLGQESKVLLSIVCFTARLPSS